MQVIYSCKDDLLILHLINWIELGTAPVVPFLPTYAKQLGFSSVVVGTIYTVLPITGMLAKPLFGVIADRYYYVVK